MVQLGPGLVVLIRFPFSDLSHLSSDRLWFLPTLVAWIGCCAKSRAIHTVTLRRFLSLGSRSRRVAFRETASPGRGSSSRPARRSLFVWPAPSRQRLTIVSLTESSGSFSRASSERAVQQQDETDERRRVREADRRAFARPNARRLGSPLAAYPGVGRTQGRPGGDRST